MSTDIVSQVFALEKASTNIRDTNRNRRGLLPGNSKLLLVSGVLDVVVGSAGVLLLLGSIVDCSGRSGKTVKEIKAGEYLIYPRVLRPATKLLCMYQKERGGCIVDCKIEIPG